MYVFHVHAWYLRQQAEVTEFSETRVTDGCELPYRKWESNLSPMEDQLVFLTTEPTIQHYLLLSKKNRLLLFFFIFPSEEVRAFFPYALAYQALFPPTPSQGHNRSKRRTFYYSHLKVLTHLSFYLPESSRFPGVFNCPC